MDSAYKHQFCSCWSLYVESKLPCKWLILIPAYKKTEILLLEHTHTHTHRLRLAQNILRTMSISWIHYSCSIIILCPYADKSYRFKFLFLRIASYVRNHFLNFSSLQFEINTLLLSPNNWQNPHDSLSSHPEQQCK